MQTRSRNLSKATDDGTTKSGEDGTSEVNEKEAKLQKTQSERLRQLIVFFLVLLVAGVFVASQEEANHIHGQVVASGQASDAGAAVAAAMDLGPSEEQLQRAVDNLDEKVRAHKKRPNMIIETDPDGMKLTKELQHATHKLLVKRYGRHTFRIKVDLIFPDVIVQKDGLPAEDYLLIELAPIDLIPCSVYNFLEIARTWKTGAFHRNANHVLQVSAKSAVTKSMPFQEYSPEFPHRKGTTGYAGRPSGPAWYISIMDNTVNHGPGSQQKRNPYEADALFGRVVQGMDTVVPRIHSVPQSGWLDKPNQIQIPHMEILIPKAISDTTGEVSGRAREWVSWNPSASTESLTGVVNLQR